MTWYLIFTGFVAVLGVFTLWLGRKDRQTPTDEKEYTGAIED
ncbi:MAG: hypothetical protein WB502_06730 [Thermoactinomyces sp.]